jgi:phosphodiesterase/alkaline phosphatase D-like protein
LYKSPIIHKAVLNNLLPGTKYYYQCGDITNNDLSAVISFTTLPAVGSARDADGQLLTFAIMADTSTTGVINGNMSAYLYA